MSATVFRRFLPSAEAGRPLTLGVAYSLPLSPHGLMAEARGHAPVGADPLLLGTEEEDLRDALLCWASPA